jgi:hypothetical protein
MNKRSDATVFFGLKRAPRRHCTDKLVGQRIKRSYFNILWRGASTAGTCGFCGANTHQLAGATHAAAVPGTPTGVRVRPAAGLRRCVRCASRRASTRHSASSYFHFLFAPTPTQAEAEAERTSAYQLPSTKEDLCSVFAPSILNPQYKFKSKTYV